MPSRHRVDGQIIEVPFKEGNLVKRVGMRLDDRLMKAQIAQAEATVSKDRALLRNARRFGAALVDGRDRGVDDQARFAVEGLKASVHGDHQCSIAKDPARLSHHTRAHSQPHRQPQRRGHGARRVGSAAGPINQTKPIWVTFAVPQASLAPCAARLPPRR